MTTIAKKLDERYSWSEYRNWPEDERWELIDGIAYGAAAPATRHQDISMNLSFELVAFFKGKECRPFPAPTDVKLSDWDVVQPDLLVVCDPEQVKPTHVEGAPKLVIEILSASTTLRDRHDKMHLYAKHGVKEYWIITPFPPLVEIYLLDGSKYWLQESYTLNDQIESPSFPGLAIPCKNIFNYPFTPEEEKFFEVREPRAKYNASQPT